MPSVLYTEKKAILTMKVHSIKEDMVFLHILLQDLASRLCGVGTHPYAENARIGRGQLDPGCRSHVAGAIQGRRSEQSRAVL